MGKMAQTFSGCKPKFLRQLRGLFVLRQFQSKITNELPRSAVFSCCAKAEAASPPPSDFLKQHIFKSSHVTMKARIYLLHYNYYHHGFLEGGYVN